MSGNKSALDLARLLGVAQDAVDIALNELWPARNQFVHGHPAHPKGDRDFVTEVDLRIQKRVHQYLNSTTPHIGFLGEESVTEAADPLQNDLVWTLDPIDGTSNFSHGLMLCSVSLALLHYGEPVVGITAAKSLDLRYHATKDGGAFRNGMPIRVSETTQLNSSLVSTGDYAVGQDASEKNWQRIALTTALIGKVERIRMFGAATLDLAFVAEGSTDACIMLSNKPWDTAAGVLLAREAGALVTDANGTAHSYSSTATIAAAPGISAELLALVRSAFAK